MNSRQIFLNIFGKERGITKTDIEKCIIENKIQESAIIEYKSFQKIEVLNSERQDSHIIAPLVSFLNKTTQEGGMLILGIDAKDSIPTKILPINKKLISDFNQLRSWITVNLLSMPSYYNFPTLEIQEVYSDEDHNLFIIEVHPVDNNVVYFSRQQDRAYRRIGDTTEPIPLMDTLRLIEEKSIPRISIALEKKDWQNNSDRTTEGKIKLVYNNKGCKPGFRSVITLMFKPCDENANPKIFIIRNHRAQDVTSINSGYLKVLQYDILNRPLYPNAPTVFDTPEIKFDDDLRLSVLVEINEEKSFSASRFIISKEGVSEDGNPEFRGYF